MDNEFVMYSMADMEEFYKIKLLGLINSCERILNTDFDCSDGKTKFVASHSKGVVIREVDFVCQKRAMEAFIQDCINNSFSSYGK